MYKTINKIWANHRGFQDKTAQETRKKIFRWRNKRPWRMDHQDRIIERQFKIIGSYYWWSVNDDPNTVQPTWIILKYCRTSREWYGWKHRSSNHQEDSWQTLGKIQLNDCTIGNKNLEIIQNLLYVKYQFKGTCNKCGTYGQKIINFTEIK